MRYLLITVLLLAMACSAMADSTLIDFNSYATGTIHGQNGWSVYQAGIWDEAVTTVGGNNAWRISNLRADGIVIHAGSKALTQVAGQSAARNTFRTEFWWKTAGVTGDESMVQISPDDGSGSRWGGRLDITNFSAPATFDSHTVSAGVQLHWDTIVSDHDSYIASPVLNVDQWYRTAIEIIFVPGVANATTPNDVVTITTYDAAGNVVWNVDADAGASTWELAGYGGLGLVDRLVWRTRWNANHVTGDGNPLGAPAGFYFDDVSMATNRTISVPTDYATIQGAIDAASNGDTIIVSAGTYHEALTVNKSLSIIGDVGDSNPGPGENAPVLDGTGFVGKSAFKITGGTTGVTISGFDIRNYGPDDNTDADGIVVWSSNPVTNVVVTDNKFTRLGWNAVLVGNEGQAAHSRWTVERNIVEDYYAYGIELTNCGSSTISDNIVTARPGSFTGIMVACYDFPDGGQYDIAVSDLLIESNAVSGVAGGTGIRVFAWDGDGGNAVTMNNIDILSNIVSGCNYGIHVWEYAPGAVITNVSANDNSLVGNATMGLKNLTAMSLDGQSNWWGRVSGPGPVGPGLGDKVSTNVDYAPWLSKPANDNALYLVPSDASVYVKPTESVVFNMNVANLTGHVNSCQALLGYNSSVLTAAAGCIEKGGGVWDEVVYNSWDVPADQIVNQIDTILGVKAEGLVGTAANGTVAVITLTPAVNNGTTNLTFRQDAILDPTLNDTTFLGKLDGTAILPAKVDSVNIIIDGIAPSTPTLSLDRAYTNTTDVVATFGGSTDTNGVVYQWKLDNGTFATAASPVSIPATGLTEGVHTVYVKAVDPAENESEVVSATFTVDHTGPIVTISPLSGTLGALSGKFIQGAVTFTVTVDAAVAGQKSLVVTLDGTAIAAVNGEYTITIDSATANGSHAISAKAIDNADNETTVGRSFEVNKNQITGTISMGFAGPGTRTVTLVANGGINTWTPAVDSLGAYTITDVPDGVTALSAKTAWTLRQKLTGLLAPSGQIVANFTLKAGDINNSNSINALDYSLIRANWLKTTAPNADVDGNGAVGDSDYNLMKLNWFKTGDAK